jgi:hypothetical protein
MPLIPSSREVKIGSWFKGRPGKSKRDPVSKKKKNKLNVVIHTYNPSKAKGGDKRMAVQSHPRQKAQDSS